MNIYDFTARDIDGNDVDFSIYKGTVLLIINTATSCGFTPQYEGLEALYEKYNTRGFEILDFPCNQFAHQAPGTNKDIAKFCRIKYKVSFRQFEKIEVNGENEHPLYTFLKSQKGGVMGSQIKWNFTKFLVDREGNVIDRFAPASTPDKIEEGIRRAL